MRNQGFGIADLHIHTVHSYDATITMRELFKQALRKKISVVAITDHDQIKGGLEARDMAAHFGVEVIPGAEVSTSEGHLVALFIEKLPPKGRSLISTLEFIEQQGGLAIVPHPFNSLPSSLNMESVIGALTKPISQRVIKGIEVHNMSTQRFDGLVQKMATYLPFAYVSSSDAHVNWAIGTAHTIFPGTTAQDLRRALENRSTVAIAAKMGYSTLQLFSWVRNMTLLKLGWETRREIKDRPWAEKRIYGRRKPGTRIPKK